MPSLGATLRSEISLRKDDPVEEPQIRKWLEARKSRNAFDPAILDYPASEIFAARTYETTHAYLPVQQVAMLESVGTNPTSTTQEVAHSLVLLVNGVELIAQRGGQNLWDMSTEELKQDYFTRISREKANYGRSSE